MTEADKYEHEGVEVQIHYDHDPASTPRDWDNLGIMYCWHPNYDFGDEQFTRSDHESIEAVYRYVREDCKAIGPVFPLFIIDHSGVSMRTGKAIEAKLSDADVEARNRFIGDDAGWDTSWVGFIYTTKQRQDLIGTPDELLGECLEGEIETYDQFLTGDVYGYIVGEQTPFEDSCWGYYGIEDAKAQANAAAEGVARSLKREQKEAAHWAERDTVTIES